MWTWPGINTSNITIWKVVKKRFSLNSHSHVIEVASNDGYLLKNFVAEGIPCLGIEPTKGTAEAARKKGIAILEDFFDEFEDEWFVCFESKDIGNVFVWSVVKPLGEVSC